MTWLRDFPSTNATVVTGLGLAVVYVVTALAADVFRRPLGEATHIALASFIALMIGLNFGLKRFSDRGLAAARASGPSPVNVEGPSRVNVTQKDTP